MTPMYGTLVTIVAQTFIFLSPVVANLLQCSKVVTKPTPSNPLYSHSKLFGANNATPKDVEALKYYCLNDLIHTILTNQMVSTDNWFSTLTV